MGKLIATDLDGTLLPEGTFDINPEYYEVIRKLHDEGNVFVAASGRHYSSMLRLLEPVREDVIFLCGNGTFTSCRGVTLDCTALPDLVYEQVLADMRAVGGFICADTPDTLWTDSGDEAFAFRMSGGYRVNLKKIGDLMDLGRGSTEASGDEICSRGILKLALHIEEDADPVAARLRERYGSRANIMSAGQRWVDCVPAGVDKGIALSKLQKRLGFSKADTIAFGDNGNDVGMLRCAGESFCVENGRAEAKAAADYVIGRMEDDAVLSVLKRFLRSGRTEDAEMNRS